MKIYFNNCSDFDFLYSGVYYRSKTQTEIDVNLAKELKKSRRIKHGIAVGFFFITEIKDEKKQNILIPEKDVQIDKVFK